ncbi:hypothetical protein NM688_g5951 [Phlebia brevispora]|uniref:Uncharacterized protein n=1 Tax=Phlebia brevispora TaxID=194682 RepID=A0ACC1SM64_9APHY|nr:hypothetical protein NM688_g5951 [Phlebia brevispora]
MSNAPSSSAIIRYEGQLTLVECTYAALALIVYEHTITLPYEYKSLWQRKWTAATLLFIANRYSLLASIAMQAMPVNAQHSHRCYNVPLQYFVNVVANTPLIISPLFSALRVFALLDRAYLIAGCVLVLGLVQLGITLYLDHYSVYQYVDDPVLGPSCFSSSSLSESVLLYRKHSRLSPSGTLTTIAADIIAIATTFVKTYRHVREATSVGLDNGFGATLVQYGTLYFVILAVVNILLLITTLVPSLGIAPYGLSIFIVILPNIVLSRFLIQLRQVGAPASSNVSRFSRFSAPDFHVPTLPEFLGNLGAPLADVDAAQDDEEEGGDAETREEGPNALLREGHNEAIPGASHPGDSSGETLEVRCPRRLNSGLVVKPDTWSLLLDFERCGLICKPLLSDKRRLAFVSRCALWDASMSIPPSDSITAATYELDFICSYCLYSALALTTYEHVITLKCEYKFLWQRRWNAGTWLFIANRYIFLAAVVAQCVPISAQDSCSRFISAMFSALRVFALLDHAYCTAACVFLLGLVQVAIFLYAASHSVHSYVDDPVLVSTSFPTLRRTFAYSFSTWPCSLSLTALLTTITTDIVAIVTTWIKTYRHVKQAASAGIRASFGAVLIRYGTLYFIVILAVYILPLILFFIPSAAGEANIFITTLPNIMLSRFLINLQEVRDTSRQSNFSALSFRMPSLPEFIGNLGEPLADGNKDQDGEEQGDNERFCEECLDGPHSNRDEGPSSAIGTANGCVYDPPRFREIWLDFGTLGSASTISSTYTYADSFHL